MSESTDFQSRVVKIKCQFLCNYPVKQIDWQEVVTDVQWKDQKQILDNTWGDDLNRSYPIKREYQLAFLKRFIQALEQIYCEVHDEIYEAYCQLQCETGQYKHDFAYKHYLFPKMGESLSIREHISYVTEGTTGLCSWQASLALSDWLLHNSRFLSRKSILELGAGTGICGFVALKFCQSKHVVLSDGCPRVIYLLHENMRRNFFNVLETPTNEYQISEHQKLRISHLPWNKIKKSMLNEVSKPDIILAADVIYDSSLFEDLVQAFETLFSYTHNSTKLILAATIRNENTFTSFLKLLATKNFSIKKLETIPPEKSNFYWDRTIPVEILFIYMSEKDRISF